MLSIKVNGESVKINNDKLMIPASEYIEINKVSKMEIRLKQFKILTNKVLKRVKRVDQFSCFPSCFDAEEKKIQDAKLEELEQKYKYLENLYNSYGESKRTNRHKISKKEVEKILCKETFVPENKFKKLRSTDFANEVTLLEQEINSFLSHSNPLKKHSMKRNAHNKSKYSHNSGEGMDNEMLEDIPKIISKLTKIRKKLSKKHYDPIPGNDDILESLLDKESENKKWMKNHGNPPENSIKKQYRDTEIKNKNSNKDKDFVPLLADIPKTRPRMSKTISTFYGKKPPASLRTRHSSRLHFDSPFHELSTIDETFSADESHISFKSRRNS